MYWYYILLITLVLAHLPSRAQVQEGLVGHWSFNHPGKEILYDSSQYANHGINHGGDYIEGVKGKALFFNGESNYASLTGDREGPPSVLSDLGRGSISLWFKVLHIPTEYGIAPVFYYGAKEKCDFFDAANQGLIIELGHSPIHYGSERVYYTIWKNGCTYPSFCYDSNEAIPEGEWHHLVVVVGDDYNTGYLNGQEMVNRRYNFGNPTYSQFFADALAHEKLWLGKGHWDRTTQYYRGAIDELRIYNRPLTGKEVKKLYESGKAVASGNLPARKNKPLTIYPNPSSGEISWQSKQSKKSWQRLSITNLHGKRVLTKSRVPERGHLNLEQLPPGIYFLELHGKQDQLTQKFILQP